MIFANNRHLAGSIEIEPNTNYEGIIGCYEAMIDQTYNDQLLFESLIGADFVEVKALREGTEFDILNEGTLGDIFKRVKKFLQDIFEKIMGVIADLEKKLIKLLKKDAESLLKKYEADFKKNDTSDMKYKWREYSDIGVDDKIEDVTKKAEAYFNMIRDYDDAEGLKKFDEDYIKDKKIERAMLAAACDKDGKGDYTDSKDFDKDFEKHAVKEEKEEEGLNEARKTEILEVLRAKEIETDLIGAKKKLKAQYDKLKKEVEDTEKKANEDAKDDKGGKEIAHKIAVLSSAILSQMQSADNRIIPACVRLSKDKFNMCKSVFVKGANHKAKKKDDDKKEENVEEAVFMEALADAVYHDDSFFE